MTLQDLRRYAVRAGARIHFHIEPAGECLVNEHGVLRIPALRGVPDFRIDSSLPGVEQFTIAPVQAAGKTQDLSRAEFEALLGPTAGPATAEHDE